MKKNKKLGITTLKMRRLHGDLIEVLKNLKDFDDIKHIDFFTTSFTHVGSKRSQTQTL